MQYIAHKTDDGREQTIAEHLMGTAKLSKGFALDFCAELACYIGVLHDIGKYSEAFQARIRGKNIEVEHSASGAQEAGMVFTDKLFKYLVQYCIAGHHTGLPDGGTPADLPDTPTLFGRMRRKVEDYAAYKAEITPSLVNCQGLMECLSPAIAAKNVKEAVETYAFLTKYLFSCLTDADFIDTERFCSPQNERGITGDFEMALSLLNKELSAFTQDTAVRRARAQLQRQAAENSKAAKEINILDMPTGSGKTLCSIKIALERAVAENKRHIIYVIPFTSILEQTADKLQEVFGSVLPVLQHHSNYSFEAEEIEDATMAQKLRRSCENWDAPLIVTTSVQFFQSLYHYKGSRLRKLHNLSDAIIIFDEIHLIPIEHLQPCFRAIGYITKWLNSKAIFLSATMPDYTSLFSQFLPQNQICELISDKACFSDFKNCQYNDLGKTDFEQVVQRALEFDSSLIIVNSRKSAKLVYGMLCEKLTKKYHLSSYMTPEHRSRVIAQIKECLKNGEKLVVVSTSLVEAGVDFDFKAVFRQLAGLDSILQAGGRCNREGDLEKGSVFIFETDEETKGDMQIRANITADILKKYSDITSFDCVTDYYNRLFAFNERNIKQNTISEFADNVSFSSIPFRSYAESFDYIKSDTIGIAINCSDEINGLLEQLKFGGRNTEIIRKLQKYTVSVYSYEFANIQALGIISETGGVFVLQNDKYYSEETGLTIGNVNFDKEYIV